MPAQPPAGSPFTALATCRVRTLLIGGNAMIAYGSDRLTQDCDFAVISSQESNLASALAALGYTLHARQGSFSRYMHLARAKPVVDVMLLTAETFEKLWIESREVLLGGEQLRVPKPLHLVALKLHALKQEPDRAAKDWGDIRYLLETTRGSWTSDELSELATRYSSSETRELLVRSGYL